MEGSCASIKVLYFGMHPQTCKRANPAHVRERDRQESSMRVQGQPIGEETPVCVQN